MSADATSGTGRDHSPALCAPLGPEAQIAEHERQFREMLEFCPAALVIVDEDGRLLFHNARLRELLGYQKEEIDLIDTRMFWHDLEQRARAVRRAACSWERCISSRKLAEGEELGSNILYVAQGNSAKCSDP
jgi:PAS domain-containing protein